MKPFNLEEALAGKPCVTRCGIKVSEINYFKSINNEFKVISVIRGDPFFHTLTGKVGSINSDFSYDLFMAEEEKEMCLVCTTFSAREEEKLCNDCLNVRDRLLIFELAKRIKALEEKLK